MARQHHGMLAAGWGERRREAVERLLRRSRVLPSTTKAHGGTPGSATSAAPGAATLALAGGANLKVVSGMLGHSTIAITADNYTSVLPEVARVAVHPARRL